MNYNIRTDLAPRPLWQQIEILWISGPTWHNAQMIADRLGISVKVVEQIVYAIEHR